MLSPQFRLDVSTASDDDILNEVVALIDAYVDQLRFSTDDDGLYNSSPYDVFLIKNGLPRSPDPGESEIAYSQRLLAAIDQLSDPVFVTPKDGKFEFHNGQPFQFGAAELAGLKIFFTQPATPEAPHSGNCIACHAPPNFTDFKMHNTGASQVSTTGSSAMAASRQSAFPTWSIAMPIRSVFATVPRASQRERTIPHCGDID